MSYNIKKISKKRSIEYYCNLTEETLPKLIYSNTIFDAFKLDIKSRVTNTDVGELNFLIRDKSNILRYIILYCYMDKPNTIFQFSYYLNNEVVLPSKYIAKTETLIDDEVGYLYIMDFISNYVSKNYIIEI